MLQSEKGNKVITKVMSVAEDVLTILTSYSGGYKKMIDIIYGRTYPERKKFNEDSLRTTLYRLKNKGLVSKNGSTWSITKSGREFMRSENRRLPHTTIKPSRRKMNKNMIVAFDIPETHKRKRAWLRFELVNLGFKPIQKSVWFGPAPLPEEFIKSLNKLNILSFLKFFRATEEDLV